MDPDVADGLAIRRTRFTVCQCPSTALRLHAKTTGPRTIRGHVRAVGVVAAEMLQRGAAGHGVSANAGIAESACERTRLRHNAL